MRATWLATAQSGRCFILAFAGRHQVATSLERRKCPLSSHCSACPRLVVTGQIMSPRQYFETNNRPGDRLNFVFEKIPVIITSLAERWGRQASTGT